MLYSSPNQTIFSIRWNHSGEHYHRFPVRLFPSYENSSTISWFLVFNLCKNNNLRKLKFGFKFLQSDFSSSSRFLFRRVVLSPFFADKVHVVLIRSFQRTINLKSLSISNQRSIIMHLSDFYVGNITRE